jgi:hypothetical protein
MAYVSRAWDAGIGKDMLSGIVFRSFRLSVR